jgi:hypothetical protein
MNLVNRVLVVMELLAFIIFSLIFIPMLLFARSAIQNLFQPALTALSDNSGPLNPSQVICVGILTLISAFSILLLLLELQQRGVKRLRLQSIQGADVLMSSDAITQQLEYTLDALTDVIKVRPQVYPAKGKAVDLFVELWTTANVDVQAKTQEVMGVARQVVEDRLGLKVGKVQIKLDQMKMPKKGASTVVATKTITETAKPTPTETKSS